MWRVRKQDGIATRRQLLEAGVTPDAIRWRVKSGRWRRMLPGVYATFSGTPTRKQQLMAAFLYAGPHAQVSGLTALELLSMRYAPKDRLVHLLVPHDCHTRSVGFVRLQRTARLDPRPWRNGLLVVSPPARAVADAARARRDLRQIRAMVAESVQSRLATVAALRAELDAGPRRASALLRQAIDEVSAGTRSAPEAELRTLLRASRVLPKALWNPKLKGLPTPDAYFAEARLVLEVDSRAHHTSPVDWERTMRRHNTFGARGLLVLHFSPARIRRDPVAVLAEIERAYRDRAPKARPG